MLRRIFRLKRQTATRRPLGRVSPAPSVPKHIQRPPYIINPPLDTDVQTELDFSNLVPLSADGIARMRESCYLAKEVLEFAGSLVTPGITTEEIDAQVHDLIVKKGAYPSPLGYKGFPRSICTSVNDVAVHGIPDDVKLQEGDVISIDVTVYLNGYHGDTAATYIVGKPTSERAKELVVAAYKCREAGILACGPGKPFKDIGAAIEDMAERFNFTVCPVLVGHGINTEFHTTPTIIHVKNLFEGTMIPGLCFTVEPVVCAGSPDIVMEQDGWTLRTEDGCLAAQFEHTVLITNDGVEVLTA